MFILYWLTTGSVWHTVSIYGLLQKQKKKKKKWKRKGMNVENRKKWVCDSSGTRTLTKKFFYFSGKRTRESFQCGKLEIAAGKLGIFYGKKHANFKTISTRKLFLVRTCTWTDSNRHFFLFFFSEREFVSGFWERVWNEARLQNVLRRKLNGKLFEDGKLGEI